MDRVKSNWVYRKLRNFLDGSNPTSRVEARLWSGALHLVDSTTSGPTSSCRLAPSPTSSLLTCSAPLARPAQSGFEPPFELFRSSRPAQPSQPPGQSKIAVSNCVVITNARLLCNKT